MSANDLQGGSVLEGKKVVLAYSGGLDTSVCLKWLEQRGANALYGGRYPLFTALGRPLIAKKLVEAAREVGATHIAHGSTGKGNDQVRFDVTTASVAPDLTVVAPVRDWSMSRPQEMAYAEEHGIPVPTTKESPYSVDQNLWGRSIEAGPLEDPNHEPTPDVFEFTAEPEDAPEEPRYVEIGFEEGLPVSLDSEELPLLDLISDLNNIVGGHGVGRI